MNDYLAIMEVECISKMEDDELQSFKKVFDHYAPKLATRIILDGSAFTSHDVYHCLDIYKIISYCLFNNEYVYSKELGLSRRELYILNLAVLFHDIGMTNRLGANRSNHSQAAADYIDDEYKNTSSVLRTESGLRQNEIKALKAIVKAHSDVKDISNIQSGKTGLNDDNLKKELRDLTGKKIRSLFLAGVLRLADELDVTSERLGDSSIESEIEKGMELLQKYRDEGNEGEVEKWRGFAESQKHWAKLHLFESVDLDKEGDILRLIIDEEYVERKISEGQSEKQLAREIISVYEKVAREFISIKTCAFSEKILATYIVPDSIEVFTMNESLQKEIGLVRSRQIFSNNVETDRNALTVNAIDDNKSTNINAEGQLGGSKKIVAVIDVEFENELAKEVNDRQLLQFGHFLLNDRFCARDWINVRELIETRKLSDKIVSTMVKHINNNRTGENITIVGVDMVGALIASRIAFFLQKPMSYIVSSKNENYNTEQEIGICVEENEKLIVITEAIATFATIEDLIRKYGLQDKIDSIYTVFLRGVADENVNEDIYSYPVFCLNNSFPIEIVEKNGCKYNAINCFAKNRH